MQAGISLTFQTGRPPPTPGSDTLTEQGAAPAQPNPAPGTARNKRPPDAAPSHGE